MTYRKAYSLLLLVVPNFWRSPLTMSLFGLMCLVSADIAKAQACSGFQVGAAQSDITGPIAEVGMLGYGTFEHRASGLHMRTRSRALVISSNCQSDQKNNTVAIVVNDQAMVFDNLKREILNRVDFLLPGVFRRENLMFSATHSHAAAGGFSHLTLYNLTTLGFLDSVSEAIIQGSVESIVRAYHNREEASLALAKSELQGAGFNRSLEAYMKNSAEERALYKNSVDETMTLLRAVDSKGKDIASFNWFPTHPVSLPLSNSLISGDNKGLAAYLQEKARGATYRKSGEFVAGFLQSNSGDVSPYPLIFENYDSSDYWSYMRQSAYMQFEKAESLREQATRPLSTTLEFRGFYKDMNHLQFGPRDNQKTCKGMLGVAFAAGTENGAPVPIFKEGTRYGIEWPDITVMPEEQECQKEKVILLPTGAWEPAWTAHILYFQIFRIGELAIVGAPFELTTMAGRRLRKSVMDTLAKSGVQHVVITALANDYAHYVTTPEEYTAQNYEGGSNLFGANSLFAYQEIYRSLAEALVKNEPVESNVFPPDLSDEQNTLQPSVVFDRVPLGKNFGDVAQEVRKLYQAGEEVQVVFWGAHPNNDNKRNQSYLTIEKYTYSGFEPIAYDWDDHTWLRWERDGLAKSKIAVGWRSQIDDEGEYRICVTGSAKPLFGRIRPYSGCSKTFSVR